MRYQSVLQGTPRLEVDLNFLTRFIVNQFNVLDKHELVDMSQLFPFQVNEQEFLNCLLARGEIKPELLTDDMALIERINLNPALKWKAHHVKLYKH